MAQLYLYNCTCWPVEFWRVGGTHKNVAQPGKAGIYEWGATYTLKVRRAPDHKGEVSRAAVNQAGAYYAYRKGDKETGKLDILDKTSINGVRANKYNPYHAPQETPVEVEAPVAWDAIDSFTNNLDQVIPRPFHYRSGFEHVDSETHRLTVTDAQKSSFALGAEVTIEAVKCKADFKHEVDHEKESMYETMALDKYWVEKEWDQTIDVEPDTGVIVWQPFANVLGRALRPDHFVIRYASDGPPEPLPPLKVTVFPVPLMAMAPKKAA